MPRTVWTPEEKKRKQAKEKAWILIDDKMRHDEIRADRTAEQIGCTPQTLCKYKRERGDMPLSKMMRLLGAIRADDEMILKVVKAWQ